MRLSFGIATIALAAACGSGTDGGDPDTQRRCPAARADTTVISLEDVFFADDNTSTIELRNGCTANNGDLVLDLSVDGHAAFSISDSSVTLAPGERRSIEVAFDTAEYGAPSATLTATTNDPDVPTLTISLTALVNPDQDQDGFTAAAAGGTDCDDLDATIRPGATEIWYDGVDQDCDGSNDYDQDGDGFDGGPDGPDCDDENNEVQPGATEATNGVDDDCDGWVDEHLVRPNDVVITEIMADPEAVDDTAGEWFELQNTTERTINLRNWLITDQVSDRFTIDGDLEMQPGERRVLGVQGDSSRNGGVNVDYLYSRGSFRLGNISSVVGLEVAGTTVSLVEYSSSWELTPGASISLDPLFVDRGSTNDGRLWCKAVSLMPGGDAGSPGDANDNCTSVDHDADGFSADDGDCDDADDQVYPDAPDRWNGVDDDCDGVIDNPGIASVRAGYIDGASRDQLSDWNSLSVGDVDADGDVELMVGTINPAGSGEGKVYSLDGGDAATWAGAIELYDEAKISGTGSYNGEAFMAPLQDDVTGDGALDLVIGGSSGRFEGGVAVAIYAGGSTVSGAMDASDAVAVFNSGIAFTSATITSHLDMDADGVAEVIYGEPGGSSGGISGAGRVYLIDAAGASGEYTLEADHTAKWAGTTAAAYLGTSLAGGDLDGDGYDDVVMCAEFAAFASTSAGGCAIVDGSKDRPDGGEIDSEATALIGGNSFSDRMGLMPTLGIGDFDGDTKLDLAIPMPDGEHVLIYFSAGDLSGTYDTSDADVELSMSSGPASFGSSVAVGDLNGDGTDDLAVGAPDGILGGFGADEPGRVWVFSGDTLASKSTVGPTDAYGWVDGERVGDLFGWSLLVADVDDDGRDDVVAGAPNYGSGAGRVSIVLLD